MWIAALLAAALSSGAAGAAPVDTHWYRQALRADLERYVAATPAANGFLKPRLDRRWRPYAEQSVTLVSQARLLFVLATGYAITGEARYRAAVERAARFLLAHFRDREMGGWVKQVSPSGQVMDDHKDSYSHAFAMFALTHAWRATGRQEYLEEASQTWVEMKARLRDDRGFLRRRATRDFATTKGANSQDPMMHAFEALLLLHEASGSAEILADARALADAIFGELFETQNGFLPELYDDEWRALPPERGGHVSLGHQFEWAWLLSEAVRLGFPERHLTIGSRLLDYGMKHGYDRRRGGFFSEAGVDSMTWWTQCEAMRALIRYAHRHGREDLWPAYAKTFSFVRERFIDAKYGGWFRGYDPASRRIGHALDKGSETMAGYHVTNLYLEALRPPVEDSAGESAARRR